VHLWIGLIQKFYLYSGFTTSILGEWVEKSGPRKASAVGTLFWSSALCTTAAGVHFHSLPLVYVGYGLLGGIGWGLMYMAPVTTVMKFFPDRRGLATGLSLSAFGAGAAIAPSIISSALDFFFVAPEFIGSLASQHLPQTETITDAVKYVDLQTLSDGSQVIAESSKVGTPGEKVMVATESDLARLSNVSTPGVYKLGTGDTGVAKALGALGIFYGAVGALGSRFMKVPHPDWSPGGHKKEKDEKDGTLESEKTNENDGSKNDLNIGLPASYVTTNTVQFPLLWLSIFGNATGGLALLSSSKLMLTDIWAGISPDIVTSSFATGYVSTLGIGMAVGRFGWSALSDYLGRQNTYALFGLGIPIVGFAPTLCHAAANTAALGDGLAGDVVPMLSAFYGGSVLAITFYGGIFSVLPAYIADLFGQKHAGAIHGKALTAWASSAVAGPMGLAYLRSQSVTSATHDLIDSIEDEDSFQQTFGCNVDDSESIQTLIDAKTISINRLMELVPDGTADPTPFLYDTTCYIAAGLMGVSAIANLAIRPLDVKQVLKRLEKSGK
jgi:MFS family permease